MTFEEVLDQAIALLQRRGRLTYRTLKRQFQLPFVLLADEQHEVADAYGSWVEKHNYGKTYWGTARTTFLVDPDGRIAHAWPKVKPDGHAAGGEEHDGQLARLGDAEDECLWTKRGDVDLISGQSR